MRVRTRRAHASPAHVRRPQAPSRVRRAYAAVREGGERGSLAMFVAIFSLFVIMLAGLVLDGGLAIYARQRAADEAEQAARYSADDVDVAMLRSGSGEPTINPGACGRAAAVVARYGDATDHTCQVSLDGRSVEVSVTITFQARLLGIIPGLGTFKVTSHATAQPVSGI